MRIHPIAMGIALAAAAYGAQRSSKPTPKPTAPATKSAQGTVTCATDLGAGVKTGRQFCDVVVASTASESVAITIPPHAGPATVLFDLHNRFIVPPPTVSLVQAFTRHTAVVAIIRATGEIIDRAAVRDEYRTTADLFDRIGGTGRGAPPKTIAPGNPQPVRVTIPATVNAIGIVGTRLEEWRATGRGAFETPNRPIAIASNFRIEYKPR